MNQRDFVDDVLDTVVNISCEEFSNAEYKMNMIRVVLRIMVALEDIAEALKDKQK
jgi:hypothetical protein